MSTEPENQDTIDDTAALWLAEAEEGLTAERQREFVRWQEMDPRHAAAVRQMQWGRSILRKLPQIRGELQPVIDFPTSQPNATSRRTAGHWRHILGGCAAAVVLGAAAWMAWPGKAESAQRYACDAGGYQRVTLQDGSLLELNEHSKVVVKFLPRVRHISLEAGEAHFSVAKDANRPFVVEAKGLTVRAIGTAFRVRIEPSSVDVLVTEGRVTVNSAALTESAWQTPAEPVHLGIGQLVEISAGEQSRIETGSGKGVPAITAKPTVEKATPESIRRALDWQEKRLFFSEVPLREVVAQFNRRNRLQLVVDDQQLASRPVGGTFAADNVEGFVRLLESSGTVTTDRRGEFEIVLRPRSSPPR